MGALDYDADHALIKTYNYPLVLRKAVQEVQGIAAAIIYDGRIDDSEIALLRDWLNRHIVEAGDWPLSDIVTILKQILSDGAVTEQERSALLNFLSQFAAGPKQPEVVQGIFDTNPQIVFSGHSFLFTGRLIFGTRKKAESSVTARGGLISTSSVTEKLNFLVVGELGSEACKFSRFGAKIERAMNMRKKGSAVPLIVEERRFVQAVISTRP